MSDYKSRDSSFPFVPVLIIGAAVWFITRPSALLSGLGDTVDSTTSGVSDIVDSATGGVGGIISSAGGALKSVGQGLASIVDAVLPW